MTIRIDSIVSRPSYGNDILFRVTDIKETDEGKIAILSGEEYRLIADAPFSDLIEVKPEEQERMMRATKKKEEQSLHLFRQELELIREKQEYRATNGYRTENDVFQIPGRVLHMDGDSNYLKKCLDAYEKIGLPVYGVHCQEEEMPKKIGALLEEYRPDILIITGHDSYSKTKGNKEDLEAYRHSKYFVQTVRLARRKFSHLDQLVIFAGACQSHFESLIRAGANFASSPSRVNIHALDPVYISAKIGFTPFNEMVDVREVLRNTLTGGKGLGGIETKGVLRLGMPFQPPIEEEEKA
ncbi:sporulation peptidase YabG [Bacillus thermotolerans]|uniref:Sporulation-specific protease YabG n=1 Tax=Bacillus thermotolerans TaxID=1221996 RepID=A0A0F5I2L8_BACTR|nr:sporulation peptidase YabG [Bacillus thermotolerans]KKB35300.1 Sporulation-specific protease YabG [Bacillus thermotolerans]KKB39392.1 Sporulation-specific protease YabG [Bacillus thermotolerans]